MNEKQLARLLVGRLDELVTAIVEAVQAIDRAGDDPVRVMTRLKERAEVRANERR